MSNEIKMTVEQWTGLATKAHAPIPARVRAGGINSLAVVFKHCRELVGKACWALGPNNELDYVVVEVQNLR